MQEQPIPYGYCQCGCGQRTQIALRTYGTRVRKGEPYRFAKGHYVRTVTPPGERLLRHVAIDPATGCWNWTGAHNDKGYGSMNVGGGRTRSTHCAAYEAFVGPIPDGLELDHLCRNTICCNPAHLEPVTGRVNKLRSDNFTAHRAAQTHCIHGHEFTPENIIRTAKGCRECRECHRLKDKRRYWREKEQCMVDAVERSHVVQASAWCDSAGCEWRVEDTGTEGVARARRLAVRHAKRKQHEVALDVTSLDRYRPVLRATDA